LPPPLYDHKVNDAGFIHSSLEPGVELYVQDEGLQAQHYCIDILRRVCMLKLHWWVGK